MFAFTGGRRGGISGLSKSGWLWVEKGKSGGGKWAKRWLELDPDGELRMYNKTAAKDSENFTGALPPASPSPRGSPPGERLSAPSAGSAGTVVRMNCEVVTIRSPKNARKDHPYAFRLEAVAGTKNTASSPTAGGTPAKPGGSGDVATDELKFILEPVAVEQPGAAGSGSGSVDLAEMDGEGSGMAMMSEEEQLRTSAYNAAFGVAVVKSAEEEAQEWIEVIQAAGAAAAQRTAQREMALDDDVDSVLLMQIERLSEEAVLLPVLEPLLAAAAATTAQTFGSAAVPRDPYGDEPMAAGDVSWQMSTDLAPQNLPVGAQDGPEVEQNWEEIASATKLALEEAYADGKASATVTLPGRDYSGRLGVIYTADFGEMLLTLAEVSGDGSVEEADAPADPVEVGARESIIEPATAVKHEVLALRRRETPLHHALRTTRGLPMSASEFSLRPAYHSPTEWEASLACLMALGGSFGAGGSGDAPAGPALLPWVLEGQLVRLRDQINAQYIAERLLPGRDPDAPPLPSRVLGADDLLPVLCFLLARGRGVETARPDVRRLTTLLAWCGAMAEGGGSEGEWMAQAVQSALTHLMEVAAAPDDEA